MKVGIVCPYNLWKGGGVQECCLAIQHELTKRGHTAKIIAPQPLDGNGVVDDKVVLVGNSATFKSFHTTGVISFSASPRSIDEMLDKEKFDVLHFHEPWLPMLSRQILSRSKSINIATSHATLPEGFSTKALLNLSSKYTKSLLRHIDAYTAVSPSATRYIRNFVDDTIRLIPNGIDLSKYQPLPKRPAKSKTILYIGRLEKRKGVEYLLQAFELLSRQDNAVKLVIAGDGPLRQKQEMWVQEQGLKNVRFLGYVSENKKHRLLSDADVFCSPALYGESFGIVLLEAMAMGVVTVAGNNEGYSHVMQGEGKTSLVDPTDTKAFKDKLSQMLHDEKVRAAWLDWAKRYVAQFDYPKVVDQYESLYKETLTQQSKKKRQQA